MKQVKNLIEVVNNRHELLDTPIHALQLNERTRNALLIHSYYRRLGAVLARHKTPEEVGLIRGLGTICIPIFVGEVERITKRKYCGVEEYIEPSLRWPGKLDAQLLDLPLNWLNLPKSLAAALEKESVRYIGQLIQRTSWSLMVPELPCIQPSSVGKVMNMLQTYDLSLGTLVDYQPPTVKS
ncbi:hypothetical protein J4211_00765 [Candidatus Woesearchaeota archaeon]|nr:hypothetical protein [Candidatus Woesearchaeota archaeon]